MKFVDTQIVFQEVPDETTLAINISNCPCRCDGCHSSYLADDIGDKLDYYRLKKLINNNIGITCVAFMGGDSEPERINAYADWIKDNFPRLKVAWYSGRDHIYPYIDLYNFDYIKIGSYKEELGPLNKKTTNQRFYKIENKELKDITFKFWKNEKIYI